MDNAGNVTVLRRFVDASGGYYPGPLVVGADGALYGPAVGGVSVLNTYPGLVYRFDPATGDFRVLHNFNLADGKDPTGPLFQGDDGYLYGTTWQGGPSNTGVIYKVDPAGNFTLLHTLQVFGVSEGWEPNGNLVRTTDGSIYGTTHGSNGSVFRLDPNGIFNILHTFDNYASDGWRPVSGLIQASDGYFYGTAPIGGQPVNDPNRSGVVYRMDQAGTVTVMHTFTGPDGSTPRAALVQGADGQLYGSTVIGGAFGLGVLFRIDPASPLPTPGPTSTPIPPTPTNTPIPGTSTGFLSPSANAAQTSSAGDNNGYQTSPANAYANDSSVATDTNSGTNTNTSCTNNGKDKHRYYNYNFNIPATAVLQGIQVRLDARADAMSGSPKICVQLSWDGGTTWTTAKSTTTLSTTEATYTLGSISDTWGHTWTSSNFSNTNFRIRVNDVAKNTSRDFFLDYVAVNVTYQP
jgi:uncharacterized repeat protein (TIGR03803 family)